MEELQSYDAEKMYTLKLSSLKDLPLNVLDPNLKQLTRGKQLSIPCEIQTEKGYRKINSLIDSGASREAFINKTFTKVQGIKTWPLQQPYKLEMVNGR